MISGKFNAIAGSSIFLALVAALVAEHRTQTALKEDALSMRSEVQRLAEELAAIRRDGTGSLTQKPVLPDNQEAELLRLRAEIGQLRQSLMTLQRANATTSNQLVAARGVEVPIIYPDAVRRQDYVFSGYDTPQSALQSVLWAVTRSEARSLKASLAGTMADGFALMSQDVPEGVMPGGFGNGEMFKASGYRVLDESPISQDEVRLKVFLEGSRIVIKCGFKRIGAEWKWFGGGG